MERVLRIWACALFAGAVPCAAQLPIDISVEYATFMYDEAESIVEIYLAVGAADLSYAVRDTSFVAAVPATLGLWRATDASLEGTPEEAVWYHAEDLEFVADDTAAIAEGWYHVRQLRITVPPGEYELRVAAVAATGQEVEVRRDMIVPAYATIESCAISDITLATRIEKSGDRNDPFFKNGLAISPNANQLYGQGMDRLWYYAEAYDTQCAASDAGQYTLFVFVSRANAPMPDGVLQRRRARTARPVDVLVGSFSLSELGSGSYFLRMVMLNEANEAVVEQSRKFFVFNPTVAAQVTTVAAAPTFETSEYATMPDDELERALEHVAVIANDTEKGRMRRIRDPDERRRFLMNFWQVRDPNPNTPANEYREEFYTLLGYANERYSTANEEGWRSDRGRTIIKYGQPSSIEPRLYEADTKPHEIWNYNSIAGEGKAVFIFADLNGFGIYELIHSTVTGERKLANWQVELRSTRF